MGKGRIFKIIVTEEGNEEPKVEVTVPLKLAKWALKLMPLVEGKIKEQIISLLQQNKKLTSSQLSNLIGLSRTRCNEYFRELTKEGYTEGVVINRQKYYKLVGK